MNSFADDCPSISVLVPVYNREKYIVECVESILSQDFMHFEVVIVDNKSTDKTFELCQEIASRDSRVRVFQNGSNIGPVLNWMQCVREARGKYSKIVFSDDLLLGGCLEKMYHACLADNIGFVFSAAKIGVSADSGKVFYQNESDAIITFDDYIVCLLNHFAPLSPGAIMIRTADLKESLLLNIPTSTPRDFLKNGAGPDVLISLITASKYTYVACISEPLVFFRAHEDSFSISNTNNEVTLGYVSAISYFLKYNASKYWLRYVAISWIQQVITCRAWVWPGKYLIQNEGNGKFFEVLLLLKASIALVFSKLSKFR